MYYSYSTPYMQLVMTEADVNQNGETYGSGFYDTGLDLVSALGVNSVEGYVRTSDLGWNISPSSPEEALVLSAQYAGTRSIPVYLSDGVTVVDTFVLQGTAQ